MGGSLAHERFHYHHPLEKWKLKLCHDKHNYTSIRMAKIKNPKNASAYNL